MELSGKVITKCCPDCGSTTGMHNSWCRIHLTPINKPTVVPIEGICIIHNIKLDKFLGGKLGCLICWKNKMIVYNLDQAIKNGLPHDSYTESCTDGTNTSVIEELKKLKEGKTVES